MEKMKSKWVSEVIYLNSYIKWKSKEQIIEEFKNIKLWYWFVRELIETNNKI